MAIVLVKHDSHAEKLGEEKITVYLPPTPKTTLRGRNGTSLEHQVFTKLSIRTRDWPTQVSSEKAAGFIIIITSQSHNGVPLRKDGGGIRRGESRGRASSFFESLHAKGLPVHKSRTGVAIVNLI